VGITGIFQNYVAKDRGDREKQDDCRYLIQGSLLTKRTLSQQAKKVGYVRLKGIAQLRRGEAGNVSIREEQAYEKKRSSQEPPGQHSFGARASKEGGKSEANWLKERRSAVKQGK